MEALPVTWYSLYDWTESEIFKYKVLYFCSKRHSGEAEYLLVSAALKTCSGFSKNNTLLCNLCTKKIRFLN